MSINKTGLRKVQIGEQIFEWKIRQKPTYSQGIAISPLLIVIQSFSNEQTKLIVDVVISRPDNWINPHQTSITPKLIKEIINSALQDGWMANKKGKEFQYKYQLSKDRIY